MRVFTNGRGNGSWIDGAKSSSFEDAQIVVLPGGADVNPELYGHEPLPSTHVSERADAEEWAILSDAVKAGKFVVGICKGAQMLTAKAGGWLIQDVSNHHSNHPIETFDGNSFRVNSCHHQMCFPYEMPKDDYKVLGWSKNVSTRYLIQGQKELTEQSWLPKSALDTEGNFMEPEVLFYPEIRGFGIQGHPEWATMPKDFTAWVNSMLPTLM